MSIDERNIKGVFKRFNHEGKYVSCSPLGNGHINDTYLIISKDGDILKKYVLQRINNYVFKEVDKLMHNAYAVSKHIYDGLVAKGISPKNRCLNYLDTKLGSKYTRHKGKYYRAYEYIDDVVSIQVVKDKKNYYQSAVAFGRFQKQMNDFEASGLYDTIPDFHNTRVRYNNLLKAIDEDLAGRKSKVQGIIDEYIAYEKYVDIITNGMEDGSIPIRVTHNDTKINNVLLDKETYKGVCVIDLDTVMRGSMLFDFGDAIRSGVSSSDEDEGNSKLVICRVDFFKAYAEGYLSKVKDIATEAEVALFAISGLIMTIECGMRFITDYLEGDKYFKVNDSEHNLRRAITHLALAKSIEDTLPIMEKYIQEIVQSK